MSSIVDTINYNRFPGKISNLKNPKKKYLLKKKRLLYRIPYSIIDIIGLHYDFLLRQLYRVSLRL